jgi:hypothetical protein
MENVPWRDLSSVAFLRGNTLRGGGGGSSLALAPRKRRRRRKQIHNNTFIARQLVFSSPSYRVDLLFGAKNLDYIRKVPVRILVETSVILDSNGF